MQSKEKICNHISFTFASQTGNWFYLPEVCRKLMMLKKVAYSL
jgi:hypothetical protein